MNLKKLQFLGVPRQGPKNCAYDGQFCKQKKMAGCTPTALNFPSCSIHIVCKKKKKKECNREDRKRQYESWQVEVTAFES